MPFEFLVSQGRIADRSPGAIRGARLAADALRNLVGLEPLVIGAPSAHKIDDWSSSLPEALETLNALQHAISAIFARGNMPLIVANTCSASLATLPIVARNCPDAAVLWIDAHGDFNTPATTMSGYLGGMVLAAGCGLWDSGLGAGIAPKNVVVAGARDIDLEEQSALRDAGVQVFSVGETRPEAILKAIGDRPVWIHIDWDVLEPGLIPAAYAISDGLAPTALRALLQAIPRSQIAGIELAEFEASDDEAVNAAALTCMVETVSPLWLNR
ncbi:MULTISPECIES: arginase family protein [unclassified Rhizobium]|uniref:arginase family protein n=1 Tax=unclassified Rhizobium TaxID=2613769 RepID=UPI001ADB942E|nr:MULTISPECIES: arginase family protein [unclassified Rhizobium]MBO9127401.1 arginase family protein [Rhizobium sp. 16-488-2b]MBO9177844.1 arginase family protein [Rhizobium sp. 16-488-2a]